MKKKILSFATATVLLVLSACNKILDTTPSDGYTSANYYQNAGQLQQALNAIYGTLVHQRLYSQVLGFNFCASNDELLSSRTSDGDTRGLRFNFDASNTYVATIWQYCYIGIQNANALIDNIDTPSNLNTSTRNTILGQALFLRGYFYFLLTMHYGKMPLILHVPGISDVNIPANEQSEIYAQIEADMKEAEALLAEENYTSARVGYNDVVTLTAVQAILARVYLYWAGYPLYNTDKYQDVLTYTDKVINSGLHELNPNYRQVFINLAQDIYDVKESIWEIGSFSAAGGAAVRNTGGTNDNDIGNFVGPASNYLVGDTSSWVAAAWVRVTKRLFDAYEVDPNSVTTVKASMDIRRDWNCANYLWSGTPRVKTTIISPWAMNSGKFRREYCPLESRMGGIYGINWPVIRYSDVLLMKAEAEFQLNGATDVGYDLLNQVRRRGYGLMNGNVVKSLTITDAGSGYTSAPVVNIVGGGGAGAAAVAEIASGRISGLYLSSPGLGTAATAYSSEPSVVVGLQWAAGTAYVVGNQVAYGGNLYTVTAAGVASSVPPTQTAGASSSAVTGAQFTYAGIAAMATATLTAGDEYALEEGLSGPDFLQAIKDERLRELNAEGLRRFDLIRWGNYVSDIKSFMDYALANNVNNSLSNTSATSGNPNGLVGLQNISARHVLLPIPTYELNVNKALVQNNGW